ncbi:MAG TPA: LPS export ABC transporter periplasmic protein LptC [Stellaceae bacterium]|nr:LPS export ABC transporter periplasmic protein LptC [Stellaceae bacterium]
MRLPVRVLEQEAGSPRGAAARLHPFAGRWRAPVMDDRYSRRVAFLKRALPAIGVTLLLLVAGWSRLPPLLESVRLGFPAIDLREARELRMVNPRYGGLDRDNRPYVVTAAIGRQVPDRNDVMALERPKAVMTAHDGASIVLTAATGIYQSQAQLLDLFGDVNLVHENGTRFVTQRAHANLSDNSAEGHDPVEGHGPSGDIAGQGFRILSKGETIVFNDESDLLFKGIKSSSTPAEPPALPAAVAATAARIEAAVAVSPVAPGTPLPPAGALATPTHGRPTATHHVAAQPHPSAKHAGRIAVQDKRAVTNVRHHDG